jgi:flagellar hook-basal body complex protein FliE
MAVNIAAGAAAYADTARKLAGGGTTAPVSGVQGTGTGFSDLLKNAVEGAINTEKQGEAASMAGVAGKADINSVVAAVTNAEMTLQTVVAVRDKVVQAYQQILQMPI